jgi:hypothetical protein
LAKAQHLFEQTREFNSPPWLRYTLHIDVQKTSSILKQKDAVFICFD